VKFSSFLSESNRDFIFLDPITENEVTREIDQLKVNKSGGNHEMSPKVVRAISVNIVKPLTYIYNQIFLTELIPSRLKIAIITTIYKSNYDKSFSNYRPISVLSCFAKILEKLKEKLREL